ncbi:hypothetical protein BC833DRAFT_598907 [Globomyces pollinis-pini]|nr:hypothetical protein BC833DRAFT_598907 [Globomyces pollinis-pini]
MMKYEKSLSSLQSLCVENWPDYIHILSPQISKSCPTDNNILLVNEHGKDDALVDLQKAFLSCNPCTVVDIVPISLDDYEDVLITLENSLPHGKRMVVVNLCDGSELDGYPGLSIVNQLEKMNIAFTGAGSAFYEDTTSKPVLKRMLQKEQVPTSVFVVIRPDSVEEDLDKAAELADWPLIIKPSVSYASISITDRSVVETREAALKQINAVIKETNGGVFIESFLAGREFTALCSGDREDGIHVYPVAERVFNKNLKERQRILAFDRYWDGYDLDGSIPTTEEELYWYEKAQEDWQDHLRDIAGRAYLACGGSGYGRVDIRTKNASELNAYVLEVNANCGLSFGKNSSSLGEILNLSNVKPSDFCNELIHFALNRQFRNQNK